MRRTGPTRMLRALATACAAALASRSASLGAQSATPAPALVTVRGAVYDSIHGGPLERALVSLDGAARKTYTDSAGVFTIDSVAPGTHTLVVAHDALRAIGLNLLTAPVRILPGMRDLKIAIPSFTTFWRADCGRIPPDDSLYLSGVIAEAGTARPVANALVRVSWTSSSLSASRTLVTRPDSLVTTTDESGAYGFCGVPTGVALRLMASRGVATSGLISIPESSAPVRWRNISIGRAGGADSLRLGSVTGTVALLGNGRPVASARVFVETGPETRTDSLGHFTLRGVEPGTQQVTVASIGYTPASALVDVVPGATSRPVTIRVEAVTTLSQTVIEAKTVTHLNYLRLVKQIDDRKQMGLGRVIDSTQFDRLVTIESLFNGQRGVNVVNRRGSGSQLVMNEGTHSCLPTLFIDGIRQPGYDQGLLWDLHPDEVGVVEIYASKFTVPMDLTVLRSDCGAVAVWSKLHLQKH